MNPFALQFHTPAQISILEAAARIQDDCSYYSLVSGVKAFYPGLESDLEMHFHASNNGLIPERIHNLEDNNIFRNLFKIPPGAPSAFGAVFPPGSLSQDQIHRINTGTPWQEVVQELIGKK